MSAKYRRMRFCDKIPKTPLKHRFAIEQTEMLDKKLNKQLFYSLSLSNHINRSGTNKTHSSRFILK